MLFFFELWIFDRLGSARIGWAGLGSARLCLPKWVFRVDETAIWQKNSVSRRRDDTRFWKRAFCVGETLLFFELWIFDRLGAARLRPPK